MVLKECCKWRLYVGGAFIWTKGSECPDYRSGSRKGGVNRQINKTRHLLLDR